MAGLQYWATGAALSAPPPARALPAGGRRAAVLLLEVARPPRMRVVRWLARSLVHGFACGLFDHVGHDVWLRDADSVGRVHLGDVRVGAVGLEPLFRQWNGEILQGDDLPGGLTRPGGGC